jgi:glutathione S-transferase
MITLTAFADSPDEGQGQARDMRVRWALEEVGQPYQVHLLSFARMREPAHLALHPFGQIPTYEEGDVALFETGAILLRIAGRYPGLLPAEEAARERAVAGLFAALNTVEPPIVELEMAGLTEADRPWHGARVPLLEARIRHRLDDLSRWLGNRDWLDGTFSVADLMMVTVLRRVEDVLLFADYPALVAYVARGTDRPAYRRAFADQLAVFTGRG